MNSIPALAVICICLYLAAGNTIRLEAQTKATTTTIPSILDATFYIMEKLHRYRVSYPSDWNVTYDNYSTSIIRSPDDQAILIISVTNLSSKTNYTSNLYFGQEINDINSSTRDKKFDIKILESIPYLLSGNTGYKIIYLNETQSGGGNSAPDILDSRSKTVVAWTVENDRIYRISCTANESKYPTYANIFTDIMNSFELLQ